MISTETKAREANTPETTHPDETCRDDEKPGRRSFSLRALLPGPYVRYPK